MVNNGTYGVVIIKQRFLSLKPLRKTATEKTTYVIVTAQNTFNKLKIYTVAYNKKTALPQFKKLIFMAECYAPFS